MQWHLMHLALQAVAKGNFASEHVSFCPVTPVSNIHLATCNEGLRHYSYLMPLICTLMTHLRDRVSQGNSILTGKKRVKEVKL